MSHGGGGGEVVEPNLTPLLDLVLQLLMFFLIVANFVEEQNNKNILLPDASTAVPIEPTLKDLLALNVNDEGKLVLTETDAIADQGSITRYLTDQYKDYKKERGGDEGAKKVHVVVRGDSRANFESIHRVMQAAKNAGFDIIELRATMR